MCMMIWHPPEAEPFTREEFADFHRRNPHGFGIVWTTDDGCLRYDKWMATVEESYATYTELTNQGITAMLLHWRLRTSGPTTQKECHPFVVSRTTLVMHNGVLSHRSTPALSDTQCYIKDILAPDLANPRRLHQKKWRSKIYRHIGSGNKLALWQAGQARPHLIGEDRGLWHRGRWYSNTYAWTMPQIPYVISSDTWDDDDYGVGWLPLLPLNTRQQRYANYRSRLRKKSQAG